MTEAEYRAYPAVNWSTLKYMRESPLHYRHALDHAREDTTGLAFGRAVHCLALTPDRFADQFAIFGGEARRGKEWLAFRADYPDHTILKVEEYEHAARVADAVRAYRPARPYLDGAACEVPVVWRDPVVGLECKGLVDLANRDCYAMLDLKTTGTVDKVRFSRLAARMGYPGQLAHYTNGVQYGLGWTPHRVGMIVVEKAPPHDVALFWLDDDALTACREEVSVLLSRVAECRASGEWPGRYQSAEILDLPDLVSGEPEISFEE